MNIPARLVFIKWLKSWFLKKDFWDYGRFPSRFWLFGVAILIILLLAFYLRFNRLTQSPPGFYLDEASIGYNAYSMLKTGKDEYGVAWPLFFRAFGEYKNPVFIYALVPLIAINGLSIETIRLGAVVWGSLGVLATAWLALVVSRNKLFSLLSALVLTLTPWHIHYSRMAYEAITLPTLFIFMLAGFVAWIKTKKISYGVIFCLGSGLTFYSYTTARFWLPFTLSLIAILFRKYCRERKWAFLTFAAAISALIFPIIPWLYRYPGSLLARFNQIALWSDKVNLSEVLRRFFLNFMGHWDPRFLFINGDPNIRHSSQFYSELLFVWLLFLFLGIYVCFKYLRKQAFWQLVMILIAGFPLAASLTK